MSSGIGPSTMEVASTPSGYSAERANWRWVSRVALRRAAVASRAIGTPPLRSAARRLWTAGASKSSGWPATASASVAPASTSRWTASRTAARRVPAPARSVSKASDSPTPAWSRRDRLAAMSRTAAREMRNQGSLTEDLAALAGIDGARTKLPGAAARGRISGAPTPAAGSVSRDSHLVNTMPQRPHSRVSACRKPQRGHSMRAI
jgi:hypothetical protein